MDKETQTEDELEGILLFTLNDMKDRYLDLKRMFDNVLIDIWNFRPHYEILRYSIPDWFDRLKEIANEYQENTLIRTEQTDYEYELINLFDDTSHNE